MPRKKKKYNARFPPARIKKIMQGDEDVGKVAAAVPVIISRALELFIEALIVKSTEVTQMHNSRTLSASHIKQTVVSDKKYSFLRGLVANVPDVHCVVDDERETTPHHHDDIHPHQLQQRDTRRPRGRPRKQQRLGVVEMRDTQCTAGLMTASQHADTGVTGTGTGTDAGGSVYGDNVRRCMKRKTRDVDTDTDSEATETCDEEEDGRTSRDQTTDIDSDNTDDNNSDIKDDDVLGYLKHYYRRQQQQPETSDGQSQTTDCDNSTPVCLPAASSMATHRMPATLPLTTAKHHVTQQSSENIGRSDCVNNNDTDTDTRADRQI